MFDEQRQKTITIFIISHLYRKCQYNYRYSVTNVYIAELDVATSILSIL